MPVLTSWFLYEGNTGTQWVKKIRLISKCLTSQPGKQAFTIQILPNNSRSKGNKTMKFGKLIEHNIKNIILDKPYTKSRGTQTLSDFYFNL